MKELDAKDIISLRNQLGLATKILDDLADGEGDEVVLTAMFSTLLILALHSLGIKETD